MRILCILFFTLCASSVGYGQHSPSESIWPQKRAVVENKPHPGDTAAEPVIRERVIPKNRPKFHTVGWEAKAKLAAESGIPVLYWCDMTPFDTEATDEFFASFPDAVHLLVSKESLPTGKGRGSRVVFKGRDDWRWVIESNVGGDVVEAVASQLVAESPAPVRQGFDMPQQAFRQESVVRQTPVYQQFQPQQAYRQPAPQQVVRRGGG